MTWRHDSLVQQEVVGEHAPVHFLLVQILPVSVLIAYGTVRVGVTKG